MKINYVSTVGFSLTTASKILAVLRFVISVLQCLTSGRGCNLGRNELCTFDIFMHAYTARAFL